MAGLIQRNASLPMPNQNDGALIAVIGRDEDAPPILIGRQREFVADRDGMLYFTRQSLGNAQCRRRISRDRFGGSRRGRIARRFEKRDTKA